MTAAGSHVLDRVLVLEMVRVTEAAAIAASKLIGRGDEKAADAAAVEAMRAALNELPFDGTVVIGEGERDEAPMLYIGERVGSAQDSGPKIDIALDPLEGTTLTANAGPNALAVLAIAFGPPLAVTVVPSSGSSAMSTAGPRPVPTRSPTWRSGASPCSPSPIATVPSISSASSASRIAATAASSAARSSPRPIIRAPASAAASVTRTQSSARLRSA